MTLPRNMLLCVDDVESFDLYKNEVAWTARRLGCGLVIFHATPPGTSADDVLTEVEPPEVDEEPEGEARRNDPPPSPAPPPNLGGDAGPDPTTGPAST